VSHDHIVGSSFKLIKVMCFLRVKLLKSTGLLIGLPNFDRNWQIYSDAPRYTEVGGMGGEAVKVESV